MGQFSNFSFPTPAIKNALLASSLYRSIKLFLILFLLSLSSLAENYPLSFDFLFESASQLYQEKRYDQALSEFKKLLVLDPENQKVLGYIEKIEILKRAIPIQEKTWSKKITSRPKVSYQYQTTAYGAGEDLIFETEDVFPVSAQGRDHPKKTRVVLGMQNTAQLRNIQVDFVYEDFPGPAVTSIPVQPVVGGKPDAKKTIVLQDTRALVSAPKYMPQPEPTAPMPVPVERQEERRIAQHVATKATESQPPVEISLQKLLDLKAEAFQIEQEKSILIVSSGVRRILVTQEGIITAERTGTDRIFVTGKELGYTYLHIWNDQGRATIQFLTIPQKPAGENLQQKALDEFSRRNNFKVSSATDWSLYERGPSLDDLGRTDYFYTHTIGLYGPTPYGNLDASLSVSRFQKELELNTVTLGITDGHIGTFDGFSLRAFDFFERPPDFANLVFPGISLRGGMLSAAAFNKKIRYTAFAGREHTLGYGFISPSLTSERDAFIDGFHVQYIPDATQEYSATVVHGFGKDREVELNPVGYDLRGIWKLDQWSIGYEFAADPEDPAHLFTVRHAIPQGSFDFELRNIDRDYTTSTGSATRQGELGMLFSFNNQSIEHLELRGSFDLFQDRIYPAWDSEHRLNQDLDLSAFYRLTPHTSLQAHYTLRNELGRISQYRYQNFDAGISQRFSLLRPDNAEVSLHLFHQENENFSSPGSDYFNERAIASARINLGKNVFYYLSREFNWLEERFTGIRSKPSAFETGLDWSGSFPNTPLSSTVRFLFRNEEDTESNLGFLTGEDYIEGYSSLTWRLNDDAELFGSARIRNVWAENRAVEERIETSFNLGMRSLWDTGIHWEPVGSIEGYVFQDINFDGIRQDNEPGVEKIKIILFHENPLLSSSLGFYRFERVPQHKGLVALDSKTIPDGFVLTTPQTQKVSIVHNECIRVDFGISARSEISGFVFEDKDNDGLYSRVDKGVRRVVLVLEDGKKSITDDSGSYAFMNVQPGEHTLTLNLNTIPVYYLPKVPLIKKITLFEGSRYIHNIPLKKTER